MRKMEAKTWEQTGIAREKSKKRGSINKRANQYEETKES